MVSHRAPDSMLPVRPAERPIIEGRESDPSESRSVGFSRSEPARVSCHMEPNVGVLEAAQRNKVRTVQQKWGIWP
jgi:hypothetical protein